MGCAAYGAITAKSALNTPLCSRCLVEMELRRLEALLVLPLAPPPWPCPLTGIKLRRSEKRALNEVNCDRSGRIKYHVLDAAKKIKRRIQTDKEKIVVLVNDGLSGEPTIVSDFTLSQVSQPRP